MRFYKVYLSVSKVDIELDQEDFEKLSQNIQSGNLIKVKQAIINPSFVVAIVPFEKEAPKKVTGYVKDGKFIVTEEKTATLPDAFAEESKLLADKFKVKP